MRKFFKVLFVASATILLAGYLIPERKAMPCCTPVVSQTGGIVLYANDMPGNAASTPAHVHYGIVTPIPYVWEAFSTAGACNPPKRFNWRLMFWLNPTDHLPIE